MTTLSNRNRLLRTVMQFCLKLNCEMNLRFFGATHFKLSVRPGAARELSGLVIGGCRMEMHVFYLY